MAEETPAEKVLDFHQIGQLVAAGAMTGADPFALAKAYISAKLQAEGGVQALAWATVTETAVLAGKTLHEVEAPFLPIIAAFVAPILSGLFGAEVDEGSLQHKLRHGEGNAGAQAIVEGFMKAIIGDSPAEITPTDAGSKRIASAAVQASLESSFNALVPEVISHLFPFDIGHFSNLTELPEEIIRTLGVSRLVRRALTPIVNTTCTVPATWHMNKLHRPTLLGASTLAKQIARHPDKRETWIEDLRREGYSDERIEALLNEQAKFHSVTDLDTLVRAGQWSQGEAIQHLRDQGYEEDVARTELLIEQLKRIASFERSMANAAVDAYVAGRIDEGTLGGFITGSTISAQEKAQFAELASARRICARRPLSSAEVADLVQDGILAYVDYRRALEREGRDDDAVINLELRLRKKIDDKKEIAQHRAELERTAPPRRPRAWPMPRRRKRRPMPSSHWRAAARWRIWKRRMSAG
jgi:hypothetical protein